MVFNQNAIRRGLPFAPGADTLNVPIGLLALLLAPLFLAAWQIDPIYFENQNTKYLHALANMGVGYLHEDWLANTKDGLPLFSLLLEVIYRTIGPAGYYLAAGITHFGFILCALLIYERVTRPFGVAASGRIIFLSILFILAAIEDLQIFFQGFAEQYILGGYFQTADFGVLLLLSVLLFDARQLLAACALVVLGASMHPGYVVPGTVLVSAFMIYELAHWRSDQTGAKIRSILIGSIALLALAGMSLALSRLFAPTDPQLQHEAHRILTEIRIPRHASPAAWFNTNVVIQFLICLAAALLLSPGRFRFILRLGLAALTVFTALAFLPHTETYRLVAPWRVSVVLVPLSSLALLGLAIVRFNERGQFHPTRRRTQLWGGAGVILICTLIGSGFTIVKFLEPEPAYAEFVRTNLASGQLYLTRPSRVNFRLQTGAPQYVTFKSHPYQDVEVLEWHRRLEIAAPLYHGTRIDCPQLVRLATAKRVTHVITEPPGPALECGFAHAIFEKDGTRVFRLDPAQAAAN
jgi:hypothetical protein